MNRQHYWIIARVALTLIAIFACGVWVGRMTAMPGEIRTPKPSDTRVAPAGQPIPASPMLRKVMERYRDELELTDEQFETIVPIFLDTNEQVRGNPRRSMGRLEGIERFHREIASILTPSQQEVADRMLGEARKKQSGE
jgi:hypothetical protein